MALAAFCVAVPLIAPEKHTVQVGVAAAAARVYSATSTRPVQSDARQATAFVHGALATCPFCIRAVHMLRVLDRTVHRTQGYPAFMMPPETVGDSWRSLCAAQACGECRTPWYQLFPLVRQYESMVCSWLM